MLTRTFFARAPLAPGRFAPLPVGAVTAQGELRERLIALRGGLLSRCASLFPEAGAQSAWFGGDLPGGMRAPELLDAMLLTSALLSDEELRRDALRLCGRAADTQREDGSFGTPGESFAARGRMLRAITHAYSMSGEKRLLTFMLRYMKYLQDALKAQPLPAEDAMHISDTLEAGIFLYNVTGQKAILSVLTALLAQGADYTSLFHAFPYRTPVSRSFSEEAIRIALTDEDEAGYTHHLLRTASGQNLCEGLRASALAGVLTGSGKHLSAPEAGLARMNKAHGAVCGGVTADPLLAGTHPSRGVSALSACELAASLESLLACPGGEHGADQLETLVYNAIAAAFAQDGRGVQPMQQANQVKLSRDARFPLTDEDAGLFSLSDGDALCALLGAWPRFAMHQWMLSRDDGLCAMGYAPCSVRYRLGGTGVRLHIAGRYPAGGSVRITVHVEQSAAFPIHLRIPAWAKGATAAIAGEILPAVPGTFLTVNRQWHDGDELLLTLPMTAELVPGFHQAVSVARGPLRFVYAPKAQCLNDESGIALMDAEAGFGIALLGSAPLEAQETDSGVTLRARAVPVPRWGLRGASCDQPPITLGDVNMDAAFDAELVPYACAPIRLAVLPVL
ncbi:MAG: glycoside hydrolase family 127 protein [Clostridia bacterium]|nr:glycoside hydrolase family 127 protein [Clostridia bacterium]